MSAWMITDAHADFLATAYLELIDPAADPQAIGKALLYENHASLAARYGDNDTEQAELYRFRPWRGDLSLGNVYQQAQCADYQCCEHGDVWTASDSCKRLEALIAAAGEQGKRDSNRYPWGIDDHPPIGERGGDPLAWRPRESETIHLRRDNGLGLPAGRYMLHQVRPDVWHCGDALPTTALLQDLERATILTVIDPSELEREREQLRLAAAAPKRADPRAVIVAQDDASALALFRYANEPSFTFH